MADKNRWVAASFCPNKLLSLSCVTSLLSMRFKSVQKRDISCSHPITRGLFCPKYHETYNWLANRPEMTFRLFLMRHKPKGYRRAIWCGRHRQFFYLWGHFAVVNPIWCYDENWECSAEISLKPANFGFARFEAIHGAFISLHVRPCAKKHAPKPLIFH